MSVLGALVRASLEDPQVSISDPALAEWLNGGRSVAGVSVNEKRIYGLPAYYRGVAISSGTLAGLPLKVYRKGTRQPILMATVLDNPNPRQTPFEFWQMLFANAITWGDMFAWKIRNGADIVSETWPIHPSRVRVTEVTPTKANPEGKVFAIRMPDGTIELFTSRHVFHVPYMSIDGVQGVRPIHAFRQSLGLAIAGDEAAAAFYGNGLMISGILSSEQKIDDKRAEMLKARWKAKISGAHHVGDVAVMSDGLKFEPIVLPPKDAELLSSRQWSVDEIGRMVGLPPHMLGNVDRSTSWGSGIESQVLGLVKFTFKPWCDLVEQRATRELLPGGWTSGSWFAEYSIEGLLRGDSKARADFYSRMVQSGLMSLGEPRRLENLEPVDGLDDVFLIPKNMSVFKPGSDPAALNTKQGVSA